MNIRRLVRHFAMGLGVAYASLLPQFYAVLNAETRFSIRWNSTYLTSILLSVVILALIYEVGYSVSTAVFRWPFLSRFQSIFRGAIAWFIFALLVRSGIAILVRSTAWEWYEPTEMMVLRGLKMLFYIAIPLICAICWKQRCIGFVRNLSWVCFFACCIFAIYAFSYTRYRTGYEKPVELPKNWLIGKVQTNSPSILILIFDEWSYARTYPEGRLREDLPHLKQFSSIAREYTHAYSPASETTVSMPRFLFQRDPAYLVKSYTEIEHSLETRQYSNHLSIFSGNDSWFRIILGSHIPYEELVGGDVEYAASVPFIESLRSVSSWIQEYLSSQFAFLRYAGMEISFQKIGDMDGAESRLQHQVNCALQTATLTADAPIFAVLHLVIPHPPLIWDRNGRYDGPSRSLEEAYDGNLRYMDSVLGQILDELSSAGTLQSSLIILTSDHSWREDPALIGCDVRQVDLDAQHPLRHVPFLVKFPGQSTGEQVDEVFYTTQLYSLIRECVPELSMITPTEMK